MKGKRKAPADQGGLLLRVPEAQASKWPVPNEKERFLHALRHAAGDEEECPASCEWVPVYGSPLDGAEVRAAVRLLGRRQKPPPPPEKEEHPF